ncbi:MAG: T9SS type A sorting domain-containing protein, partial [Dysgonamonadaceae bacterium]|nr:T9SS type A sorting domain-containing protein [Dysgonamonadaceae bacterium]
ASSGEDEWSHPVIGTGNTGNELGGGWYWAEIFDIAVSDGTLQIGIKGDASSNRWIGADDFHLYYIGAAQVKTVLQAAIDNATALLATIDATTMVGASLGQYTQEAYDALTAALTAANAANADETILQEAIDAAATALTNAITAFKASYQMQTNALANGDYYLKTNGYYVADGASAVQNVAPLMQTELNVSGKDQIFTITKETPTGNSVGRYAILSTLTANRNINEGAAFKDGWGTNDHDWRTMNFYYNGTAYAIQSDGSGANNGFWKFDEATTKIATSKRTVMDVTADFIFELITVHTVLSAQVETIRPTFIAAETGTAAGQYPQEVYDAFEAALETADAILAVEGSATAQNLVDFVAAAKLFVPNGTAINTLPTENRVQVTASDKSIEIKAIEPVKATVYTATGRLINETTVSGRQSIPVATGVYIVKTGANITKVIVR